MNTSINRKMAAAPTRSVIDSWLSITGNLKSEGEILVEGQINGNIHCSQLIIGKDATVTGSIIAEEVIIRGKLKGTIRANRVTLQDTAIVDSDIYHKSISIEQGACFDGSSKRRDLPMSIEFDAEGNEIKMAMPQMPKASESTMARPAAAAAEPVPLDDLMDREEESIYAAA